MKLDVKYDKINEPYDYNSVQPLGNNCSYFIKSARNSIKEENISYEIVDLIKKSVLRPKIGLGPIVSVIFSTRRKNGKQADDASSVLHFTLHPRRIFVQELTNFFIMNKIVLLFVENNF